MLVLYQTDVSKLFLLNHGSCESVALLMAMKTNASFELTVVYIAFVKGHNHFVSYVLNNNHTID